MKNNILSSDAKRRRQRRLSRLPAFIQCLVRNKRALREVLAREPFARGLVVLGAVPVPGFGLAQHDATYAIFRDLAGDIKLSDLEFECAMRVMTAPEGLQ